MDNVVPNSSWPSSTHIRSEHVPASATESPAPESGALSALEVPLERDGFMRTLLRELAGTLQDVVGLEEASGFVSVVGQNMGLQMNRQYRDALGVRRLSREQVANVLVDLKARIEGGFHIVEQAEDRIVLSNNACPFGDRVIGRPALCMMTSNVFGSITAENLGYAKVELGETIATGHSRCHVVVHLRPTAEADAAEGREYFGGDENDGIANDGIANDGIANDGLPGGNVRSAIIR